MLKSFQSNIWKAYVFTFLSNLHFIGGILIPFFMDWGKISFFQIMILQSFYFVWVLLLEIPTGTVADFLGRKTSLAFSVVAGILATLIYTIRPEFLLFLLGEFFWALSTTLASGAYEAFIYDSLQEAGQENQSKKIFGRFGSFAMVATMIGAPIGSMVAAYFGLRLAVLLMIAPFAMAFFVVLTFKEPKARARNESSRYSRILIEGVKYFYSHKILRILALDGMVIATLVFFLIWTYQLLLKQLNVDLIYFGIVHAFICASQIIVMSNFEKLEKIFGSKSRYLFFSAFISGVAFIFLGLNVYVIPAILAMLVISGFGLSRFVLISNYMQKHIESHNRATVVSAASMINNFGMMIVYPIIGLMVERSLNYTLIALGVLIVAFSLIPKIQDSYLID
ncbi:MFS transporter [Patescibacteria group bacterium]